MNGELKLGNAFKRSRCLPRKRALLDLFWRKTPSTVSSFPHCLSNLELISSKDPFPSVARSSINNSAWANYVLETRKLTYFLRNSDLMKLETLKSFQNAKLFYASFFCINFLQICNVVSYSFVCKKKIFFLPLQFFMLLSPFVQKRKCKLPVAFFPITKKN